MKLNNKIIITILIIGLFIISMAISYAYFVARIINNESTSTIVATAAYLELTFTDGEKQINASNIIPGWSESKTFKVENTGGNTAYYVIRISDITNPFVYGGINYKLDKGNENIVPKDTLPLAEMPITSVIEIPTNTIHEYTITTYYDSIEESQKQDLGKSFSYTVSIEAVNKKEINYIEDLVDLSNEVNAGKAYAKTWFIQTRDLDFNDSTTYKNANDTSYGDINGNGTVEDIKTELTTGSGFYPIGNRDHAFKGSYDGQNHRIDNLYINNNVQNSFLGLWGVINGNTIENLIISGEILTTVVSNSGIIGAIYNGNSILNNLINEINITSSVGTWSLGGIIGGLETNNNLLIRHCVNKGNISNGNNTGGVIGINNGTLIIEKSKNEGTVTNSIGKHTAGLVGRDNASTNITQIYKSSNSGNVSLTTIQTDHTALGGIIGKANGEITIENSSNSGTLYNANNGNTEEINYNVGGLIGWCNIKCIINDSYNAGNLVGGTRTGGIVGYSIHLIKLDKCYNTGNISSDASVRGSSTSVGGLLGFTASTSDGRYYILNSYNIGTITSNQRASGLIGYNNYQSYIINSYNNGEINSYYAAGLTISNYKLYINNSYNIGTINSIESENYGLFYNRSDKPNPYYLNNAYYLDNISASNVLNVGTPITSEYMSSPEFVNQLNQNKRAIDLNTIYDGALADYELSDWKYDSTKGYPVLDN